MTARVLFISAMTHPESRSAPAPAPVAHFISRWTSLAVVFLGVLVTLGWLLNWPLVTRLHPMLPSMKVTTSSSFVALGVAVYLLLTAPSGRSRSRTVGGVLALIVFVRAVVHLLPEEWGLTHPNILDRLNFTWEMRMSASTALCFAFTGSWAVLEAFAPAQMWRRWLCTASLFIAYLGLVAVGYDASAFYDLPLFSSMAVHTIFGHLALACVALFMHPGLVLRRALIGESADALFVRRLLPAAFLAPLALGWFRLWGEKHGFYQSGFGVALYTIVLVTCLTALILGTARSVAAAEEARAAAEALAAARAAELVLLQEQLQQSQKMESIGLLAGGITHDFNNILTIIILYASLAQESVPSDSEAGEAMRQVQSASQRASALTAQLLAFSRRQVLAPCIIAVNETIQELLSLAGKMAGESVRISFEPAPELANIRVDPGQLGQVLLNLVGNAKDAMPSGGNIVIATEQVSLDSEYLQTHLESRLGPHVVISVRDNGSGMDAETRAHIFEPFYTTKGVGRGTGLGLSVVYGIIKQSEGNIWVYSEPGQGTTFKLYFPVAEERVAPKVASGRPPAKPGANERILLVEDDNDVRAVLLRALRRGGYHVEAPDHPRDALPLLKSAAPPFDLLLSDMVMPEIGGIELCTEARRVQPSLRCLFMSGYPASGYNLADFPSPLSFLTKPIMPDVLLARVREALDEDLPPGLS